MTCSKCSNVVENVNSASVLDKHLYELYIDWKYTYKKSICWNCYLKLQGRCDNSV